MWNDEGYEGTLRGEDFHDKPFLSRPPPHQKESAKAQPPEGIYLKHLHSAPSDFSPKETSRVCLFLGVSINASLNSSQQYGVLRNNSHHVGSTSSHNQKANRQFRTCESRWEKQPREQGDYSRNPSPSNRPLFHFQKEKACRRPRLVERLRICWKHLPIRHLRINPEQCRRISIPKNEDSADMALPEAFLFGGDYCRCLPTGNTDKKTIDAETRVKVLRQEAVGLWCCVSF